MDLLEGWNETTGHSVEKQAAESGTRTAIVALLGLLASLRIVHWQASTKTNEHEALGDLYDSLDGLVDTYAETLMGLELKRDMPASGHEIKGGEGFEWIIKDLRTQIDKLDTSSPDLGNIAADMLQAVNKASYKLLS